ncbi:MAG: hypothetical protein ACOZCO_08650 [Bacteroidota bacterium]
MKLKMKNSIVLLSALFVSFTCRATVPDPPANTSCNAATFVCQDLLHQFDDRVQPSGNCAHNPLELYYYFYTDAGAFNFDVNFGSSTFEYFLYGPLDVNLPDACEQYTQNSATLVQSSQTVAGHPLSGYAVNNSNVAAGLYLMVVRPTVCYGSLTIDLKTPELCEPEIPCENCVASFELTPGKKYMFSCWVKEDGAPVTKTSYDNPQVILSFPSVVNTLPAFSPSGVIIDGWQRIEAEFTVPLGATDLQITLNVVSGDAYYDDIRILPFDGSMKSYVYDPETLRLLAELDERNYATIYEYDEEGKLVRVKKETERGVMTIQENKTSIKKSGQ